MRSSRSSEPETPLPEDRLYSHGHAWLQVRSRTSEHRCTLRAGLEPGLAAALLMPKAVVLPAVGERLEKGQTYLWIVMEGGTLPLRAPASGLLMTVNPELSERPHRLVEDPLEAGWAFELDLSGSEMKAAKLMPPAVAQAEYHQHASRFQAELVEALSKPHPRVGATLADGGVPLQHISDMLGPARYFALLRRSYVFF